MEKRKVWVPLENNPETMTRLAHELGLSRRYGFSDVLSLDDAALLGALPRPCLALLFTLPMTAASERFHRGDEASRPPYDGSGDDGKPVWFHQTIGHACGTIGLVHCLANVRAPAAIADGSPLAEILGRAVPLEPAARARVLYDSAELERLHAAAAQRGDTAAPRAEEFDDPHAFTAFVVGADGHLWELEGRRAGPVDRGALAPGDDALSERALDLGPRAHVRRELAAEQSDVRFSCIALHELAEL